MADLSQTLGRDMTWLGYDHDRFSVHIAGDYVVEGHEHGVTSSDTNFPDGTTSAGRSCSVFTFDGCRNASVRTYPGPGPGPTSSQIDRVRELPRDPQSGERRW